jgi:DNA-binding MarR family transcriptional regulator
LRVEQTRIKRVALDKSAALKIRNLIKNELSRRFQKNPSYSVRSFAKSVGVDQSLLSKLLKGERDLSFPMALKLGQSIGLTIAELQTILTQQVKDGANSYNPLNEDQFMIISGWQHFAILELMQTKDFKPQPSWIAKRLGLSANDVNFAVERLESCGFIKKVSSSRWVCAAPNNNWSDRGGTNLARQSLQQSLLDKAKGAIDRVDFEARENASLTIAVSRDLLPEIKKRIHKFRDEINELAMSYGKADEVYQACIAFYPLTEREKK